MKEKAPSKRRHSKKGIKAKNSEIVQPTNSISKFFQDQNSKQQLRSRSVSGTVYSTTLLVHPSESESETTNSTNHDGQRSHHNRQRGQSDSANDSVWRASAKNSSIASTNSLSEIAIGMANLNSSNHKPNVGSGNNLNEDLSFNLTSKMTGCAEVQLTQSKSFCASTVSGITSTTDTILQSRSNINSTGITTTSASLGFNSQYLTSAMTIPASTSSGAYTSGHTAMGTKLMQHYNIYARQKELQNVSSTNSVPDIINVHGNLLRLQAQVLEYEGKHAEYRSRMEGLEYEQDQDHNLIQTQGSVISLLQEKIKIVSDIVS